MAAVGDGRCVCIGHGAWSSFVARLFLGHCGCLWLFVFIGVVVGGCCGWSLPFAVQAVVVSRRVS